VDLQNQKNGKYIPASIHHGKVGEDAYFKAHYVGEFCEDKPFAATPAYVLGVADGVGGWTKWALTLAYFQIIL